MRAAVTATVIAILRIAFLLRLSAQHASSPVDGFEPHSPGDSLKLRLRHDSGKRQMSLRPRTGLRTLFDATTSIGPSVSRRTMPFPVTEQGELRLPFSHP